MNDCIYVVGFSSLESDKKYCNDNFMILGVTTDIEEAINMAEKAKITQSDLELYKGFIETKIFKNGQYDGFCTEDKWKEF